MSEFRPEDDLGKVYDSRLMSRLLSYTRPYRWPLILCLTLLLFITGAELSGPYLIKIAIDEHITGDRDIQALLMIAVVYLAIQLAAFFLSRWQLFLMQSTGQRIIYNLRQELFTHLQFRSFSFYDRNPVGRLVTRVMNDTHALNEMYANVLVNLFKDLFILLGIVMLMLTLDVQLALISFTLIPLIILATWIYRRYARDAFRQVRILLAQINSFLSENISGIRIIHMFQRQEQQFNKFRQVNRQHFDAGWRELKAMAYFRPVMDILRNLGLALLIWFGSGGVLSGALELGVLYAFIDYVHRFFQPINDLSEKFTLLQSAMASSERIFQLLDNQESLPDPAPEERVPVARLRGEIRFEHVWFAYQGEDWVLKDVNFTIQPGQLVAFVGATGAGKSSLINLLSRFYDVQRGRITIDGVDIRRMRQEDLRRNIGVVLQDVFLFTGTIGENIRLGNPAIPHSAVQQAARRVGADAFIEKLAHGYDEPVMERGATLSMGQRQLISFARTLAYDPSILVLDEATANIDTETEQQIQTAMKAVMESRTTLVIAHRLSTIQHADQIFVMHKGQLREQGTHQELLQLGGIYRQLYELQQREQQFSEAGSEPSAPAPTEKCTALAKPS